MFAKKTRLFSIGTIVVPTLVWSNQLIKLIILAGMNWVKQVIKLVQPMSKPHVSSDIHFKSIPIRPIKIAIPPDIFQQHLPKMFFQPEVGKMEIDEMLGRIKVQNLCIVGWLSLKKNNWLRSIYVLKKTCNRLKSVWILNMLLVIN
jgi:hypothetical protein